jgi:ribonuclease BN (tRNA processing enzyme)
MKLTVVGCGMAVPDAQRVTSAYYVETSGLALLLDCGIGAVHRMATLGLDWKNITHLCITHFHNDHIGDVPALFFAWRWGMLPPRSTPLTVMGPAGTKRKLALMAEVFGDHLSQPTFDLTVDEIAAGDERLLGDVVKFSVCKTPHTPESLAFRIDTARASFGYTGDTTESDEVGKFFIGVETLVMECATPDDQPIPVHLTPSSAARIANMARPRRLVLTHAYPQLDRATLPQVMREVGWSGETLVAKDGLELEVRLG